MKINKKLIGITVASLGMVFSIGGAIALYQTAADPATFGISAGTYAGSTSTVTYKINGHDGESTADPHYCDAEGNNSGTAIRPDYPQVKYEFTLGAQFANDLPAQSFVMGKVSVALTNLDASLYGKVTVYACLEGYTVGKIGASDFAGTPLINNVVIADAETVCSGARDISVAAAGVQKLVVWVKFANFSNYDLNEKTNLYDLDVTWGAVSNEFELAYVVGNGNQWTKDDEFAMAVNIEATTYEWMYEGLPGTFGEAKVVCGSTWCHGEGDNHGLLADKTYDVYWTAGGDANFAARP